MTPHTKRKRPMRKARKTFTLSPEVVEFLETVCKRRRAPSVSSVLEDILQAARREESNAKLEKAVGSYYDSLSDGEQQEQRDWGQFALRGFSTKAV